MLRGRSWIVIFLIVLVILLLNAVHASYPDEFDNILGGWKILHGILPWTGFFSHHGAMGYFFASIITIFSGQSFVRFRFLAAIFYFAVLAISYLVLKRQNKQISVNFFFGYMLVFALGATYFWGHMFLADSLSGYFLIPAYGLLFLKIFTKTPTKRVDLILISLFSALGILVSPTYIYVVAIIDAFAFLYHFSTNKIAVKELFKVITIFVTPYLLFGLYLVITRSIPDFLFQAITYNQKYYIYNYKWATGETTLNPIRYAIIIFNNFIDSYRAVITQVKDFNFGFPYNVTVAISSLFLWVYLLTKKKYFLIGLSFFALVFSTVRGNPLETKVTDYQLSVYFMLSFFNASFLLFNLWPEIITKKEEPLKPLYWPLFVILAIYWFFNVAFLFSQFWSINYGHYMGTQPMIYDRPRIAPVVNAIVPAQNYCWIGPFEFEEMLHLNCKLPSKYDWILPQFANSDFLKTDVVAEYDRNRADVIVYRRDYTAFGQPPTFSAFFEAFLDKNYVLLRDIPGFEKYRFTLTDVGDSHPDLDFNFLKEKSVDLAIKLQSLGYIKAQ